MQADVSKQPSKQMESLQGVGLLTRGGALDAADAGQVESKCKQIQAKVSKCKQMQANASKCKQRQANASKYKQM